MRRTFRSHRSLQGLAILALVSILSTGAASAQWTQWGGPNRDFTTESGKLATEWPESGPKVLWSHPFGDGYSAVLVEGDRIYTMRRVGATEEQPLGTGDAIVCLDAKSGETIWEKSYDAPMLPNMALDFGPGPIATPLIVGDRIFAIGSTMKFHSLDKNSGEILWKHDLMEEMKARPSARGYGTSPIAYKNLVIVPVGGEGQGLVAFNQESGDIAWKGLDFRAGYSSPLLVDFEGEDHLIVGMGQHRAGVDPSSGQLKWHMELPRKAASMMSTQHFGDDNLLFGSSAYGDGSRAIKLTRKDGTFQAEELWFSRKLRVMFGSFVRIGDYVYGCHGDFGPAILVAMNIKDGTVAWRHRGFTRHSLVHADGKLLILDEEGILAIATATPEGLEVHSKAKIMERTSWTPPTVVGTDVYLRDRKTIKKLNLGI